MELTVLGSSAAYYTPERASSSYMIVHGDTTLLVDIGGGSFRNLLGVVKPESLDGIIITHLHQDHFLDLYPLYYYLKFEVSIAKRLRVYAPRGAAELLGCLLGLRGSVQLSEIFDFVEIAEGERSVGDLTVTFIKVRHVESTFGVRIEVDGGALAYSSDTSYDASVIRLAARADLFICEATLEKAVEGVDHLTFREAGRLAREARVGRLMLTHIWPSFGEQIVLEMAGEEFQGEIIVANDGMRLPI